MPPLPQAPLTFVSKQHRKIAVNPRKGTRRAHGREIFGTFPENVSYAVESRTIETLSVPVKYVSSNVLPDGAQQVLQNGQPGYIVETVRTKKVDGKVVETKTISRDTYKAQSRLIARSGHISMPDPEYPSVVEDGIREGISLKFRWKYKLKEKLYTGHFADRITFRSLLSPDFWIPFSKGENPGIKASASLLQIFLSSPLLCK